MLSAKVRTVLIVIVMLAVVAIIVYPLASDFFNTQPEPGSANGEGHVSVISNGSFNISSDPYQDYLIALEANKPIVIEFYARW